MVTATIYIDSNFDPEKVIQKLIEEKLIAFATHDLGITVFKNQNGQMLKQNVNVIYVETKSLLYTSILDHLNTYYSGHYHLFSTPIVQYSDKFHQIVIDNVEKI